MSQIEKEYKQVKNAEWSQVEKKIDLISNTDIWNTGYCCYAVGVGGITSSSLEELRFANGIEEIKSNKYIAKGLIPKMISYIIPSYWGIFEIIDGSMLPKAFDKLTEQAMAELYVIDAKGADRFKDKVNSVRNVMDLLPYVKRIAGYFIYVVDTDNNESATGIVEAVDWDNKCPKELVDIFELTSFR